MVTNLATCFFVEKGEHALLYGPPGMEKAHRAQTVGHDACGRGFSVLSCLARLLATHACDML